MNIAKVSKKLNISADTLRYYERIGLIPPVKRSVSGIRDYGESDIKWIEFVKCMRNVDLPIEVLTKYSSLLQEGDTTLETRKRLLEEQRNKLLEKQTEIKKTLERLDLKIKNYDKVLLKKEKELAKL